MLTSASQVIGASSGDATLWFDDCLRRGQLPGEDFNWTLIVETLGNRARVGREITAEERLRWAELLHRVLAYVERAGIIAADRARYYDLWLRARLIADFGPIDDHPLRSASGLAQAFFGELGVIDVAEARARLSAYGYEDETDRRLKNLLRLVEDLAEVGRSGVLGVEIQPWIALASSVKN